MALEGGADLADKRLDMAARRWGLPSAQESCDDGGHLLGNVVISKNFLRTRKIMVMHSNERGECCPRTLVDR